jgi:predicted nucleotidyltransferase
MLEFLTQCSAFQSYTSLKSNAPGTFSRTPYIRVSLKVQITSACKETGNVAVLYVYIFTGFGTRR